MQWSVSSLLDMLTCAKDDRSFRVQVSGREGSDGEPRERGCALRPGGPGKGYSSSGYGGQTLRLPGIIMVITESHDGRETGLRLTLLRVVGDPACCCCCCCCCWFSPTFVESMLMMLVAVIGVEAKCLVYVVWPSLRFDV